MWHACSAEPIFVYAAHMQYGCIVCAARVQRICTVCAARMQIYVKHISNISGRVPTHVDSYPLQSLINHLQYITTSNITGEISGTVGTVHV